MLSKIKFLSNIFKSCSFIFYRNKQNKKNYSRGFTLLEVVAYGFILLAMSTLTWQFITDRIAASRKLEFNGDLKAIQTLIKERINCPNTLNFNPIIDNFPVKCLNVKKNIAPYILKSGDNSPITDNKNSPNNEGKLGNWQIRASCKDNALFIEGKIERSYMYDYIFKDWKDLFIGESKICQEYFQPSSNSCNPASDYNIMVGIDSAGPKCCKRVRKVGNTGVDVSCEAKEYLYKGGASCEALPAAPLYGRKTTRNLPKEAFNAYGVAHYKGIASPGIPPQGYHTHIAAAVAGGLMYIEDTLEDRDTFYNKPIIHGGFLTINTFMPDTTFNVLKTWSAACRTDDWLESYPVTASIYCCPQK